MGVLIKDMEKPKSCFEIIDGDFEYCPFVNTDDDCVLLLKKGIYNAKWKEQYSKCPLVETPEPCEDAVSRKDAIIQLSHNKNGDLDCDVIIQHDIETLKQLPPVTPKRKTGRWLDNYQYGYKCSECGAYLEIDCGDVEMNFCPNCRADMRGKQDE